MLHDLKMILSPVYTLPYVYIPVLPVQSASVAVPCLQRIEPIAQPLHLKAPALPTISMPQHHTMHFSKCAGIKTHKLSTAK